jgi:phage shock protein PspC (stress-responsive transcriptional regulator)
MRAPGHSRWRARGTGVKLYDMTSSPLPTSTPTTPPRMTRSTTDKKIGGVAGGLAAHLGVDPQLVRVGFVVSIFLGGTGLFAYLAMLALVPADDAVPAEARPLASPA